MTHLNATDHQLLHAYLDGELNAAKRAAFEARLAQEPSLAEALAAERRLRQQLQLRMQKITAPDSLRSSISDALGNSAAPNSAQQSTWQKFVAWLKTPQPMRPYQAALGALLLAVIVGATTLWLGQPAAPASLPGAQTIFDELGRKHAFYLDNTGLLDVEGSPAEVSRWFHERLPFTVPAPDVATLPLEGGRLGEVHHQGAAHLVFDVNGQDVSLTLFAPQPEDFSVGESRQRNGQTYLIGRDGPYTVLLWQVGEVGYALVAPNSLAQDDLFAIAETLPR